MQILDGLEVWSSNLLLRRKAFPYCRFARRRTGFIGQPNPRTVSEGIWSPIKVSICLGGLTGGLTCGRDVDAGVVVETHGEDVAGEAACEAAQIGRGHVRTSSTNSRLVCRTPPDNKNTSMNS